MNVSIHISLQLDWSLSFYTARVADLETPFFLVKCIGNPSWDLYCRHCYRHPISWGCFCRIFLFMFTCLAKHGLNQGWVQTQAAALPDWLASFILPNTEHQVGGTSLLRLFRRTVESNEDDSRNPNWTSWRGSGLEQGTQLDCPSRDWPWRMTA